MEVQRQYTGTAGRIENSLVAVYLVYATAIGHAAIDGEPYIPRSWTEDPDRCRVAGAPDRVAFATKPALATAMISRTVDAGVRAHWIAGDEVDGANPHLRAAREARRTGYVLAVACDSTAEGCRDAVEVGEEGGQARLRDRVHHMPFDVIDGGSGRVETPAAFRGEVCGKGAAVVGGGGPGDQVRVLEAAQDEVHGLPCDERAASEFGVGQAGLLVEEFEACVLRHRHAVLAQRFVHGAASAAAQRLRRYPTCSVTS